MKFYISHPPTRNNPVTYLASDAGSSATSLSVKNTVGFSVNDWVVIGKIGYENAEIVRITSITSPSTFGITSTKFPHNADTPVTLIGYDKVRIYKSTTGINGTYNLVTTLDISIDNDITYYDTTAQISDYFKFRYYNSYALSEGDWSDAISGAGFTFYSKRTLIDRVLSLFGDSKRQFVSDDEVSDFLNEFLGIAQTELSVATKRFLLKYYDITLTTNTEYDLPADFLMEKAVKISYDGGLTFPNSLTLVSVDSMGQPVGSVVEAGYFIYNDGTTSKIVLSKQLSTGAILRVWYVPSVSTLSAETDTLPYPFVNHSVMFVTYALAKCYLKDKNFDVYRALRDDSYGALKGFISYIKRLSSRHPQNVEFVE
jgi:hypothetical protein